MMNVAFLALYACACARGIAAGPVPYSGSYSLNTRTKLGGCQQLDTEFPGLISYPNSTSYIEENTSFWSETAVLSPWCVFTPKTAQDVAGGLAVLRATRTHFAVRGGGHMPVKGAASTSDGVLIAMDKLNTTQIGRFGHQTVAQIGPGLRWFHVYDWLAPQKLMVIGGRYAPVGVPGLLLGGGVSYFASARGWAADHVLNYELVTANSEILNVNAGSYPDLFWALKGGSTNYGIVTRFDLETFPLVDVYGGYVVHDGSNIDRLVQAVADYVTPEGGGTFDSKAAIVPTVEYIPATRSLLGLTNLFYNSSGNSAPRAFENFTSIPTVTASTVAERSFVNFVNETASTGDRSSRQLFRATSLKSNAVSVKLIYDTFVAETQKLSNVTGCLVTLSYQILSESFLQASQDSGGDAIDLDPRDGPIMNVLLGSSYELESDDEYLTNFLRSLAERIDSKAKAANLYVPYFYFNDAAAGQRPYEFYGKGASLPKMRKVAARYDPEGIFQKLAAGAFKLSDART